MFRLNRLTDYAVVIVGAMMRAGDLVTASVLSVETGIPQPTVAKVLTLLSKYDLVVSLRGAGGGYLLDKEAQEITVADIIQAIEGPISLVPCTDDASDGCTLEASCPMRGNWNKANQAVSDALRTVTLAQMVSFDDAFPPVVPSVVPSVVHDTLGKAAE